MSFFEEDPAADFLSREQETIGDVLGGEVLGGEVLGGDHFELITENQAPGQGLDYLDDSAPIEVPGLMSEPEMLGVPQMSEPELLATPPTTGYEALAAANEPESIRVWRQQQTEDIASRDMEADTTRAEWKAEAAKELESWHAKQNEVLEKTRAANREAEEAFLRETGEVKEGGEWEVICKLCDFNPKNNRNCKDTARMRSIFLQLKQNPLVR